MKKRWKKLLKDERSEDRKEEVKLDLLKKLGTVLFEKFEKIWPREAVFFN